MRGLGTTVSAHWYMVFSMQSRDDAVAEAREMILIHIADGIFSLFSVYLVGRESSHSTVLRANMVHDDRLLSDTQIWPIMDRIVVICLYRSDKYYLHEA